MRFKRSIEIEPWDNIFDESKYGSKSLQLNNGKIIGSEDCLTLNVLTPLNAEKLPVLVFHGGGNNTGSASNCLTNGIYFIKDGICFVSIQYRLNVLGFYNFTTYKNCENFDSICGLSDQILGLKWVHENIFYSGEILIMLQ